MCEDIEVIVFDNGSGEIKAGIAGNDTPAVHFANVIGYPRHTPDTTTTNQIESYIGNKALKNKEILSIRYPMEHGIITNWDDMEKIWHHTFYNELRVIPKEHPILLTEPIFTPMGNREKATQILFESFHASAMYIANQAILSFYSMGRTDGVILEIGDGVTQVVPINEGHTIPYAINRLDLAGRDLTDYMIRLLAERGYSFTSTGEREMIRDMKEKLCYVALDFEEELGVATSSKKIGKQYELPDGQTVTIRNERFRCPEALFRPTLIGQQELGIAELLYDTIMKCHVDIRPHFFCNSILTGGTTMISGIKERMEKEMLKLVPSEKRVRIVAGPDRRYAAWIGGSILGSLSTFQAMWLTKKDYEESGPSIIHRKCFV